MPADLQWLIGIGVILSLAMAGYVINAFRSFRGDMQKISDKLSASSADLHKRIDHVKDNYVRQDHFDKQFSDLRNYLAEMKEDSRSRHQEIKEAVQTLTDRK